MPDVAFNYQKTISALKELSNSADLRQPLRQVSECLLAAEQARRDWRWEDEIRNIGIAHEKLSEEIKESGLIQEKESSLNQLVADLHAFHRDIITQEERRNLRLSADKDAFDRRDRSPAIPATEINLSDGIDPKITFDAGRDAYRRKD